MTWDNNINIEENATPGCLGCMDMQPVKVMHIHFTFAQFFV
jgi:hypothetical protein